MQLKDFIIFIIKGCQIIMLMKVIFLKKNISKLGYWMKILKVIEIHNDTRIIGGAQFYEIKLL